MESALALITAVLLSSTALVASDFCVCRSDQSTAALQKAIDFSCGQGADCTEIQQTGACYSPNDVASHCSWAANSYYQKYRATGATCDFTGAATLSSADPRCTFPSSASAAGTTTGIGTSTGTFSPGMGTGFNGTGAGTGTGTGTSTGTGTFSPGMGTGSMDGTAAAAGLLPSIIPAACIAILLISFALP